VISERGGVELLQMKDWTGTPEEIVNDLTWSKRVHTMATSINISLQVVVDNDLEFLSRNIILTQCTRAL
jgi:hypothetical protein